MKIKFTKTIKIKIEQFNEHIGQIVKGVDDNYYLITMCAGKLFMINIKDFEACFMGDDPNRTNDFELIESELIIYD